jgi:putative transcriptional regulator
VRGLVLLLAFTGSAACAQPNGILLVAKPDMADPNFRETVVAVTRTPDASTIGVILNRPTDKRLANLMPGWSGAGRFPQPLYAGGPVMQQVVIALFAADKPPEESAFAVLPGIYLSMHPRNIEALLSSPPERVRLFAGFSGWAPRQLETEMLTGSWYAVRATEALLFRKDTASLWRELVAQARGARADIAAPERRAILTP